MKAIIVTKYGKPAEVLKLTEVEKPVPGDKEVLIKVRAASLNKLDLASVGGIWAARLLGTGLRKPKQVRLGSDVAGVVESIGKDVKQLKPGDEVFGTATGSYAEYVCAQEERVTVKPESVSFEECAAVPIAAITALQGLRDKAKIQRGQKVMIHGASGGVGTFALQIAKSFETEVTAVCSARNLENARSLGADHVIDYTKEDFSKSGVNYDLILVANGNRSATAYRRTLRPNGVCVVAGGSLRQLFQVILLGPLVSTGGKKITFLGIAKLNNPDLVFLKDLLAARKIVPLIERSFSLGETPDAVQYLEEGHAKGKLVITVD